ncbi:MAG: hypothetical protein PHQ14_13405 [Chromatiales bacterium]|jgi:hypothetical protein|nr:hypothetical protein [Chromatiales bacterium]MDX9768480.1 hypothetical protein [Ectothiorhodospiraceae bacterium]
MPHAFDTRHAHLLHALIGRRAVVEGVPVRVIEVMETEGLVVLESARGERESLTDQYGDLSQPMVRTYTVPLLSEIDTGLHPVLASLLDADEQAALLVALGRSS